MKIKIALKKNTNVIILGRYVVNACENLYLRFESNYNLTNAKVELSNEEGETEVLVLSNNQILIPDKYMVEGRLFVRVYLYSAINDRVIKHWEITPIKIEYDSERAQKVIVDYMLALEARVAKLEDNTRIIK